VESFCKTSFPTNNEETTESNSFIFLNKKKKAKPSLWSLINSSLFRTGERLTCDRLTHLVDSIFSRDFPSFVSKEWDFHLPKSTSIPRSIYPGESQLSYSSIFNNVSPLCKYFLLYPVLPSKMREVRIS